MNDNARFELWNTTQQSIHSKTHAKNIQPRRIYWVSIGQNVGSEVYGKDSTFTRPVLVLNVFYNQLFLGVPLSSKTKGKSGKLYHKFTDSKGKLQVALLGQIRVFDSKRVERLLANVDTKKFALIKHKVKENIIGKD